MERSVLLETTSELTLEHLRGSVAPPSRRAGVRAEPGA